MNAVDKGAAVPLHPPGPPGTLGSVAKTPSDCFKPACRSSRSRFRRFAFQARGGRRRWGRQAAVYARTAAQRKRSQQLGRMPRIRA